MFELILLIKI